MNHSDVRNHMADYLEGDLALERRALFDAHLDECPECCDEIQAMRGTIALLRDLPDPELPSQLANDVMRRIRAGDARAGWLDRLRDVGASLLDPRVLAPISAATLALGIVLGTGQFRIGGPQSPGERSIAVYPPTALITQSTESRLSAENDSRAGQLVATAPGDSSRRVRIVAQDTSDDLVGLSVRIQRWQVAPGPVGGGAPSMPSPGGLYADSGQAGQSTQVAVRSTPGAGRTPDGFWSADQWLDHAEHNPAAFAAGLSNAGGTTLAEHELWVKNLARRAAETERLDEVVLALQQSRSPHARSLARDFEAEGRKVVAGRRALSTDGAD